MNLSKSRKPLGEVLRDHLEQINFATIYHFGRNFLTEPLNSVLNVGYIICIRKTSDLFLL